MSENENECQNSSSQSSATHKIRPLIPKPGGNEKGWTDIIRKADTKQKESK